MVATDALIVEEKKFQRDARGITWRQIGHESTGGINERHGRCRSSGLRTGILGDGFGYVECGIFAALAMASPRRCGDRTCRRCALCLPR